MATHTLGTNATTSLIAVQFTPNLSEADRAVIGQGIRNPDWVTGFGIKTTLALTNASATATAGSASGLAVGMPIMGAGVVPGTTILALSGTTVTMSQNATASATNNCVFMPVGSAWTNAIDRQGVLHFAGRMGYLELKANDYIAIDPLSGAVLVLPPAAISLTGSIWTFT